VSIKPSPGIAYGQEILRVLWNLKVHFRGQKIAVLGVILIQLKFATYLRSISDPTVHQLFIDFKKAYDSVRRVVLYNILIVFGAPMKLVRLINMCLNETYSKVRIGK
jgi:hypothetical protein